LLHCSFSAQQCKDIFGAAFTEGLTQTAISWTNANYGGRGLRVTKVVFPNGSTDPWHALGITSDLSADAPAIYIKGTFSCLLLVGCVAQLAEYRSLAGEMTISYARPAADG